MLQFRKIVLGILLGSFLSPGMGLAQDSLNLPELADDTVAQIDSFALDTLPPAASDEERLAEEAEYVDEGIVHFNLNSPYHTILSHLYFLQDDSYHPDSAAMTLYVRDPLSEESRKLAIQLKQFYDGAGHFINLEELPTDPDYIDSISGLHKFVPVPEVPTIFVYKRNSRWVYSYATVKAIPELHAHTYPLGTLDWIPDWMRGKIFGLQIWQFFGILLLIVLAFLVHKLLTWMIGFALERFLKRFARQDATLEFFYKIARPISLLILFYLLLFFTPNLQLPIGMSKWVALGFKVMIPVFYMLIAMQVVNLVMAFFERKAALTESTLDDQLMPLLRNLAKGIVFIFFFIIILDALKVNITALVGGVAFGSLAFALAAQDTVRNLFGSLLIFVDRPFQIGDWVIIEGNEGVVEEVNVRSTRIRTFANSLITIPNGNIASTAINNMGARAFRRFVTRIGVTYDTPPDLIETFVEGIREIVRAHPQTHKDNFEVAFNEMGDFNLQILVYIFFEVPSWSDELDGRQEFLLAIMRLAEKLGIGFAFPTQTLHVDSAPETKSNMPEYPFNKTENRAKMKEFMSGYKLRVANQKDEGGEANIVGSDVSSDAGNHGGGK